jgi:S1-C subfamily serine protease
VCSRITLSKFSRNSLCFGLLSLWAIVCHGADNEASSFGLQDRIQDVHQSFHGSIVRVKATKQTGTAEDQQISRVLKMGTGFIVSKDGHVLTSGLLRDPDRVWIEHERSFYLAKLIGKDELCNISLLKIEDAEREFPFISLVDQAEGIKPGSFVIGLTSALEFQVGPTYGIIQSKEIAFGKNLFPTSMLRSSLPLGPGEVGAPVFDLQGRFAGIGHAALPDLSASFLLPAEACLRIRDGLLFSGSVDYGWFGVTVSRKLNNQNSFEIVVQGTVDGSPASKSTLKVGDVIRKIGGQEVTNRGDLAHAAFFAKPGTLIEFFVSRDGKEVTVPIKVEKRRQVALLSQNEVVEVDGALPDDPSEESINVSESDLNKSEDF